MKNIYKKKSTIFFLKQNEVKYVKNRFRRNRRNKEFNDFEN